MCLVAKHHTVRWPSWSSCTSLFSEQRHIFTATKLFSIKHASAHIQCKQFPSGWLYAGIPAVATTAGERKSNSFIIFMEDEQNIDWFPGGRERVWGSSASCIKTLVKILEENGENDFFTLTIKNKQTQKCNGSCIVEDQPCWWHQHHWHSNIADGCRWNIELHKHQLHSSFKCIKSINKNVN